MFWNVIVMFSFFSAAGAVVAPAAGEVVLELLPLEPHAVKLIASKLAAMTCSDLYFFTNVNPPRFE